MSAPELTISKAWPKDVASGIVAAQAAAQDVDHDAKNDHHGYRYTSSEAVIGEAKRAMAAGQVAFVLVHWELIDAPEDRGDEIGAINALWQMVGKEGGAVEVRGTMPALVGKGRPVDKAVATALTYLQAYALRGLLNLARPEKGAEVDQRDDSTRETRRPPRRPTQQQAPKPEAKEHDMLRRRLWTQMQARLERLELPVEPEAARAELTRLVGYDWPDQPTTQQLREAVHSVSVAAQEEP